MLIRNIIPALLILLSSTSAFAEVKIFLSHRYEYKEDISEITLGEIARIDCDEKDYTRINSIPIGRELYNDGYVDKSELFAYLKENTQDILIIYGSAVKITCKTKEPLIDEKTEKEKIIVQKGDIVKLKLNNKGISVEVDGKALDEGGEGDVINLELKMLHNRTVKRVRGRIINRNLIEASL